MRSTTLTTILLLTVAALVSCVILPPGLGQHIGLGRTCQNINAQAGTAYGLETTAALASARDTGTAVGDISPRDLSRRDPPGPYAPCGILRGNQHSAAFTLEPSNKWNAFWVDDRSVPGGQSCALSPRTPPTFPNCTHCFLLFPMAIPPR